MGIQRAALLVALVASTWGPGCTTPDGRPPIARIEIAPDSILENDNFQTVVTLDGTQSRDVIDDPTGQFPLSYRWKIEGDEFRLEAGAGMASAMPQVRFRGARPATIELTVTDVDGLDAIAIARVRLSVR